MRGPKHGKVDFQLHRTTKATARYAPARWLGAPSARLPHFMLNPIAGRVSGWTFTTHKN